MARSARTKHASRKTTRILTVLGAAAGLALSLSFPAQAGTGQPAPAPRAQAAAAKTAAKSTHITVNCGSEHPRLPIQCPDAYNPEEVFGHYVGA
jgi:hypothetical protein